MSFRNFRPSAPGQILWIIGLVLGFLGILGHFVQINILSEYNWPLLVGGFIALAIGTIFRGA